MTNSFTDSDYLKHQQYKNAGNYGVRVRFHERFSTNPQDSHIWCFEHLLAELPAEAHILELGGGQADLWLKSAKRIPAGWQITFSDFSAGMVADAQARLGDLAGRFADFSVIDAQAIPYEDGGVDAVIANLMIYHVPDRPQALSEIRRVLKPNGICFAMTLGDGHMTELYDWVRAVVPELGFGLRHTDNPFSLENGLAQLQAHFSDVRLVRYEDSVAVAGDLDLLTRYIASLEDQTELIEDAALREKFQAAAREKIAAEGAIRATKHVGLFMARG
ncbi:MAG: hypothetical protein OHK0046_40850 [Anaerolineae bacterium]